MTTPHPAPTATAWSLSPSATDTRLRGRWLIAARSIWITLVGLSLVVIVVALPIFFQSSRTTLPPEDARLLQQSGFSLDFYEVYQTLLIAFTALVFLIAGALLFWRRSDERMVLFVSSWFVLFSTSGTPLLEPLTLVYPAWQLPVRFLQGASLGCFPLFTYLFPDGRFVPRWTRALAIGWVVWIVISPFTPFVVADSVGVPALWLGVLVPVGVGIGLLTQVYRYRRVSRRIERQQTKWVLFGVSLVAIGFVLYILLPLLIPSVAEPSLTRVLYLNFSTTIFLVLPLCLLLLCIGIAILRYQLWDIDPLINRTLVYGTLSTGVVGLYVLLVGSLSALFQSSDTTGNLVITLVTTGLIAILFQPLRARLQRGINRLMYGERDDPYAVLSRLSQQLKTTLAPSAVLPSIVESVAQTLKLPYVAIALQHHGELVIAVEYGDRLTRWQDDQARASSRTRDALVAPPHLITLSLDYQGEPIGQLLVAPRAPGEMFTPTERRLLEDIALQASVAAHGVRLTADLQRSRERLVTAREEERRRLRRDLHDGLGPQLASLTLTLAAARELLRHDVAAADMLLQELATHTQAAITDIRRVVYDLRPPALDDLGLVLALREQAAHYSQGGVQITITAPDNLPPLPAAVEVAAYRIVQEALTNVIRHAQAHSCIVRLTLSNTFSVEIRDDGVGLPPGWRAGVGLLSMRERTAELGGAYQIDSLPGRGTSIHVRLPLHQEKA